MKALKEEADAALAQARMDLRRVGGAGAHNPNFPAGVKRGAVNASMRPPLFRTSLTASEAILGLRAEAAAAAAVAMGPEQRRRSRQSSASRRRPGSQLSDPSIAWSEVSSASQVWGPDLSGATRQDPVLFRVLSDSVSDDGSGAAVQRVVSAVSVGGSMSAVHL